MKKILLLFILLVSVSIYCDAQNYSEVVYLKNGSVIRGLIVEQIPDVSIKIKTYDGSLIICRMDEVLRIENGRLYKKYYNPTQSTLKGYKGFVDFGYVVDEAGTTQARLNCPLHTGINSIITSSWGEELLSATLRMQVLPQFPFLLISGLIS